MLEFCPLAPVLIVEQLGTSNDKAEETDVHSSCRKRQYGIDARQTPRHGFWSGGCSCLHARCLLVLLHLSLAYQSRP